MSLLKIKLLPVHVKWAFHMKVIKKLNCRVIFRITWHKRKALYIRTRKFLGRTQTRAFRRRAAQAPTHPPLNNNNECHSAFNHPPLYFLLISNTFSFFLNCRVAAQEHSQSPASDANNSSLRESNSFDFDDDEEEFEYKVVGSATALYSFECKFSSQFSPFL